MTEWHLLARHDEPPPADWPQRLALRLGQRPRRVGDWSLLALYGARACLDAAGEAALPPGVLLVVGSRSGPDRATREALQQAAERGLPMPFAFLQSQPSHLLATLCQHLGGARDARFVVSPDAAAVQRLALREAGPQGLLLGRVELAGTGVPACSNWWRYVPAPRATRGDNRPSPASTPPPA